MELLRALSDKTRQEIIMIFADKKEVCVNDIAKKFILSRPTISHHLNLMKRAKLLNARKEGKEIYYSFNKSYVVKLMQSIVNNLKACC
ncbi:MAG: winged helix-turn-helix transcriptional regulator [Elusimicrobia bacterium]|nr:winged helix-turn-helix transcriptional regulator [Elusimicrobiota bacterium]